MVEEKLKIIQDESNKYHFKTKDDNLINIEHKDKKFILDLFKWGDEASLQINLDSVPTTNHMFSENKVEVENSESILRVYPIDVRSTKEFYGDSDDAIQCGDGGIRFELVLKEKPSTNSFTFPIKSKNLRFSYQPFLTDQDMIEGIIRPLNVEGSYAVYHATKKNNQYKTGKAFHIYRPIVEDALGNKAWCSINIDGYIDPKNMTITVPQEFLDEATYPITIDPDFGYTGEGGSVEVLASKGAKEEESEGRRGAAWTMPAPGGFANYIRAYVKGNGGGIADCKVFINQEDSGGSGTHGQIATKENLACATAEHWEEFSLASEELTEGVDYILNITANADSLGASEDYYLYFDTNGAIDSYRETSTGKYDSPESPWVVANDELSRHRSIYCNYGPPAPETLIKEALKVPYANIKNIMKVPKALIKKFMGVP